MKSIIESGVVSVVATCRRVVGPHGVCYREWGGVRCCNLLGSSGWTVEARLGCMVGRNSSLSQQSKRRSDVFEVTDGLTVVGYCWCCRWKSSTVEARMKTLCWRNLAGVQLLEKSIWNLSDVEACLKTVIGEVRLHEESDRRSIDSGIRKALWKFIHWRGLEDTVEG